MRGFDLAVELRRKLHGIYQNKQWLGGYSLWSVVLVKE